MGLAKGVAQKIGEKRLAISIDVHPIEYALFEGQMPEGNYGADQAKIWDRGTFEVIENNDKKWL